MKEMCSSDGVGVGVGEGAGVGAGVEVAVGTGAAVGVGTGTAVGVGRGAGTGVDVGAGVAPGVGRGAATVASGLPSLGPLDSSNWAIWSISSQACSRSPSCRAVPASEINFLLPGAPPCACSRFCSCCILAVASSGDWQETVSPPAAGGTAVAVGAAGAVAVGAAGAVAVGAAGAVAVGAASTVA